MNIDAIQHVQQQVAAEMTRAWEIWAAQVVGLTLTSFRMAEAREYVLHAIDARTLDHIVCLPDGKGWRVIARGRAVCLHDEVSIHTVWGDTP